MVIQCVVKWLIEDATSAPEGSPLDSAQRLQRNALMPREHIALILEFAFGCPNSPTACIDACSTLKLTEALSLLLLAYCCAGTAKQGMALQQGHSTIEDMLTEDQGAVYCNGWTLWAMVVACNSLLEHMAVLLLPVVTVVMILL
eukprot:Lankesteria_metandrocarpae@DN7890_c0_g1_i1.p1